MVWLLHWFINRLINRSVNGLKVFDLKLGWDPGAIFWTSRRHNALGNYRKWHSTHNTIQSSNFPKLFLSVGISSMFGQGLARKAKLSKSYFLEDLACLLAHRIWSRICQTVLEHLSAPVCAHWCFSCLDVPIEEMISQKPEIWTAKSENVAAKA